MFPLRFNFDSKFTTNEAKNKPPDTETEIYSFNGQNLRLIPLHKQSNAYKEEEIVYHTIAIPFYFLKHMLETRKITLWNF